MGNLVSYEAHPEIFPNTVNGVKLSKIKKGLATAVRKELCCIGKEIVQIIVRELKTIAMREEEEMTVDQRTRVPELGSFDIDKIPQKCYYRGNKGHFINTNVSVKKQNKEPCDSYKKFMKKKYDWK